MTVANATAPVDVILSRLASVKRDGKGWRATCPAHPDLNPSLGIDEKPDGSVLLRCRSAGCSTETIVAAIGLSLADLFADGTSSATRRQPETEKPDYDALDDYLAAATRRLAAGSPTAGTALAELDRRFRLDLDAAVVLRLGVDDGSTAIARPPFLSRAWEGPPRLVIPMLDRAGVPRGLQGRAIGLPADTPRTKRWLGASGGAWARTGCFSYDSPDPLFIVEGLSDPLALAARGYPALGVRGATLAAGAVAEILDAAGERDCIVVGDNDGPGSDFARTVTAALAARTQDS